MSYPTKNTRSHVVPGTWNAVNVTELKTESSMISNLKSFKFK